VNIYMFKKKGGENEDVFYPGIKKSILLTGSGVIKKEEIYADLATPPTTSDSIPHSLLPRSIRKKPFSPQ